jgi:hypothetical protein
MKYNLYDQLSNLERESVAAILGFNFTAPGFNGFLREIPEFTETFCIGDAVDAYLKFMVDRMEKLRKGN